MVPPSLSLPSDQIFTQNCCLVTLFAIFLNLFGFFVAIFVSSRLLLRWFPPLSLPPFTNTCYRLLQPHSIALHHIYLGANLILNFYWVYIYTQERRNSKEPGDARFWVLGVATSVSNSNLIVAWLMPSVNNQTWLIDWIKIKLFRQLSIIYFSIRQPFKLKFFHRIGRGRL